MTIYAHTWPDAKELDTVPLTIKVTLPLGHWREMASQLNPHQWPEGDFARAITDAIKQIEQALSKCGAGREDDDA